MKMKVRITKGIQENYLGKYTKILEPMILNERRVFIKELRRGICNDKKEPEQNQLFKENQSIHYNADNFPLLRIKVYIKEGRGHL